ncbi:unnamed protein product, partial [Pleuronectes platessa]
TTPRCWPSPAAQPVSAAGPRSREEEEPELSRSPVPSYGSLPPISRTAHGDQGHKQR